MRTFTQKQNQPQNAVSSNFIRPQPATLEKAHSEELKTVAPSPFGHDFSRVAVHAPGVGTIQAKLAANRPGDACEREADRVSEQVEQQVDQPGPLKSLQPQRVQTVDSETPAPSIVHDVIRSPGQPLDPAARAFMEPRFGYDLSQVRVHAEPRAAESARAMNALAYTVGRDVVFGAGQYTTHSSEGRKLIAHELTHVVQQGFTTQAIQRKDDKKKKGGTTNGKLVFEQIKKRDPDLAGLVTAQSIDFRNPKEPPAIKGGPVKDGEEHVWKVNVLALQGVGSKVMPGGETKKKIKGHTQVTHEIDITWGLPIAIDKEFAKQTTSDDEAFTLSAAEPLYHELLHARIMMERDPHWTNQHTQVFQDFTNVIQVSNSPALDKERQEVKKQIGQMAAGGGQVKDPVAAQDNYYEFLVHEKYDADTEGKAFGKSYANSLIAKNYSKVVALRMGMDDPAFKVLTDKLAASVEKLFDKLDQAVKTATPAAPASKGSDK